MSNQSGSKAHVLLALAACSALVLTACGNENAGGSEGSGDGSFKPGGNVKMIVPFAAGGGSDIAGRATAAGFEDVSGVTLTVENIEGGSGAVGYSNFLAEKGNPNVLLATETALIALPITQDVQFTYEDFTPIMMLGQDFTLIAVQADSPLKTCTDLVDKAKGESTLIGISGATGLDNVVFSTMEDVADVEFDRVPFESGAELLTALLGGEVEAISVNPGEVAGQIESGDVRPLCAASDERYDYPLLEDVETAKEQGIDVSVAQFRGVLATGDISDAERDYWIDVAKKFAETDAYTTYIEDNMMQPTTAYGDDFTEVLAKNDEILRAAIGEQ